MLSEIIKEDPGLILDVLREHSEFVLAVAQQGADLQKEKQLLAQWKQDISQPKSFRQHGRPSLGPADAPVTIAVFMSFTCTYCRQMEQHIKKLMSIYEGKIRVVYKLLPLPSHPNSLESSEFMLAAYKQDMRKSWKLFDTLFENSDKITSSNGQAFIRAAVTDSGLNLKKILNEVKSDQVQAMLHEDEEDAQKLQFQGTPSFLVNNLVIRGYIREDLFRQAVDMALTETPKK